MKRGVIPCETCLKLRPLGITSRSPQERAPFSRPQPGIRTPLTITLHGAHRSRTMRAQCQLCRLRGRAGRALEEVTVRIDKEDIDPICPHCQMLLQRLIQVKRGFFAVNRVFCCPHCRKILGISAGAQ